MSDPNHPTVQVRRYKCVGCTRQGWGGTTGPSGCAGDGVMLHVLGLCYGGVADAVAAFGWAGSKSS